MDTKTIDTIKKCLELSKSNQPGEAAAALNMAQKLMEKHGIGEADLSLAEIGHVQVKSSASVSRLKEWESDLVGHVADAFGCQVLWRNGSSYGLTSGDIYGQYTFIGLKAQLPIVEYTLFVLFRRLRSARTEFVGSLPRHMERQQKIREAEGFALGWVASVGRTVIEFAGGSELEANIQRYKDSVLNVGKDTVSAKSKEVGLRGQMAGLEAGAGESLHRPMAEGEGQLQLENKNA